MLAGSGDSTIIKYSAIGVTLSTLGTTGTSAMTRTYVPGFTSVLANNVGPGIVRSYSTAKFLPGTTIRWEPSVSFTTSGRVLVGFTDNPEMMVALTTAFDTYALTPTNANYEVYANLIRGLGSVKSFPVWQETDVAFPTRLRRKRFDTNTTITTPLS